MTRRSDPNPGYWEQYGPFQHVKHELIRCYLNGWYPKLGTWARRVLYVDTHAGRGRYESGDPGSPVLALQTLLRHSYREKLLNASEFNFLFIERDPANLAALEAELSQLKPFPARINVETSEGDAFERLSAILNELRRDRAQMAPAFLFVDPYGFKIPAGQLGDLMKAGRVELFINVMWRELDMLVQQRPAAGTPHAQTLDEIFGSGSWRTEVIGDGMDERLDRAIPLMARGIGAKWWTSAVRMVTGGQATRYVLLHLTNSDDGRDLMKECAWSVSPAGGFMVRRSDNPDQQFLIKPEPDLRPLRDWILNRRSRRPERWQDLHAAVRPEWWLPKHVNELVRELKGRSYHCGSSGRPKVRRGGEPIVEARQTNDLMLPIMVGAVIYVRVSTKEQTENLSLPPQLRACEEYCRSQGYEVLERFHDEGESAKATDFAIEQELPICEVRMSASGHSTSSSRPLARTKTSCGIVPEGAGLGLRLQRKGTCFKPCWFRVFSIRWDANTSDTFTGSDDCSRAVLLHSVETMNGPSRDCVQRERVRVGRINRLQENSLLLDNSCELPLHR